MIRHSPRKEQICHHKQRRLQNYDRNDQRGSRATGKKFDLETAISAFPFGGIVGIAGFALFLTRARATRLGLQSQRNHEWIRATAHLTGECAICCANKRRHRRIHQPAESPSSNLLPSSKCTAPRAGKAWRCAVRSAPPSEVSWGLLRPLRKNTVPTASGPPSFAPAAWTNLICARCTPSAQET